MSVVGPEPGAPSVTVLERVVAPLVNSNEPEAQVVELRGETGAPIGPGEVVCVLETSKSTVEVEVESGGYLGPFAVVLDERISAGDLIVEVLDQPVPAGQAPPAPRPVDAAPRLTKKAEARARELGIDLATLPTDRILTERDIERAAPAVEADAELPEVILAAVNERSVVVIGGGGLGKSLLEAIHREGVLEVLCVLDDGLPRGTDVLGVPVIGGRALMEALSGAGVRHGVNAVGGIGRMSARIEVFTAISRAGLASVTIVDPGAHVAESARLEEGAHLLPGAVVWSSAVIGRDTLVNTGAIVSHDCEIGANVHLAPGSILAGETSVGDGTLVGMGVTTRVGARIGANSIVGNGVVVNDDVPDGTIVPAGSVWPSS